LEDLVLKYLTNNINASELEILRKWLKKSNNKVVFEKYIRDAYLINSAYESIEVDAAYKKVYQKIKQQEKPVSSLLSKYTKYAAAASVALLVSFTAFLYYRTVTPTTTSHDSIVNNAINIGTDKAVLTLEDGSNVVLENGKKYNNKDATSNGKEIIYDQKNKGQKEIVYNYLTIPRGGQYFIKLADGTQVWLNSESKLKFPVAFPEGKTRNVELVYGEAYFDVSPSTAHKGSKFEVLNINQKVEVVGTQFNIRAYRDETNIYTTLAEGKILIDQNGHIQKMYPAQQSNLDLNSKSLLIKKVEVRNEISWKDGLFIFKEKPLKVIAKTLSRWYNVDVVIENKEIENITFKGVLSKNQKIEDILDIMKSTGAITDYRKNADTILIK